MATVLIVGVGKLINLSSIIVWMCICSKLHVILHKLTEWRSINIFFSSLPYRIFVIANRQVSRDQPTSHHMWHAVKLQQLLSHIFYLSTCIFELRQARKDSRSYSSSSSSIDVIRRFKSFVCPHVIRRAITSKSIDSFIHISTTSVIFHMRLTLFWALAFYCSPNYDGHEEFLINFRLTRLSLLARSQWKHESKK